MSELLRLNVERQEGTTLVALSGELDMSTARELRSLLADLERDRTTAPNLVLDLRELTFIDSTGLEAVIRAEDRCRREGARLTIVQAPPQVHRVFVLTGLDRLVQFTGDRER